MGWKRIAVCWIAGSLVACATPYGPKGLMGGFEDKQLSDNAYEVRFNGNGKTSGDMVWNYWIYRCAELTLAKGYTTFGLRVQRKGAALEGESPYRQTKGSGYYYVPGGTYTVTTWNASAVVVMFREPLPREPHLLRARTIVERLKPYVESAGASPAPRREELINAAQVPFGAGS